ncbi:MAG: hypothetical protein QHC40_04625 [Sphingobium sp.]|nr:hypothetical protein [Sphingobium sp.]
MRRPITIAASLLALCAATPALAQSGQGRRVNVTPYLGIDQIVLAPLKGEGDVLTYTNLSAGVTADIQSRRVEAVIDLRYDYSIGWGSRSSDQDVISGILQTQVNLARGLSLNAGGLASRVRSDGFNGPVVRNDSATSQIYSAYAGPSYTSKIGDFDIGASYRLGYNRVDDDVTLDFPGAPQGGSFADSWTHSLAGSVGFGPGTLLPVGLVASGGYDREDASQLDQRFEDKWARLDATLPVAPTVALVGGVGYEDIAISQRSPLLDPATGTPVISSSGRYVTDKSSPRALLYDQDGLIWDVGVLWRPNHRTSMEGRVGQRYGSMSYTGNIVWTGRRSSFALVVFDGIDSFGRVMSGNVASFSGNALDIVRNPFTGDLTGCAFGSAGGGQCFNDGLTGITDANFRYRGVTAQYAMRGGPWNWGVGAGYSQRKFVTPRGEVVFVDGTRDENWWGTTSLGYTIDSASAIDTTIYVNYFDAGSGGRIDTLNMGAFASYNRMISRRLSATASLGVDSSKADDIDSIITAMGQVGLRYGF